jgi:hypothetical protein
LLGHVIEQLDDGRRVLLARREEADQLLAVRHERRAAAQLRGGALEHQQRLALPAGPTLVGEHVAGDRLEPVTNQCPGQRARGRFERRDEVLWIGALHGRLVRVHGRLQQRIGAQRQHDEAADALLEPAQP